MTMNLPDAVERWPIDRLEHYPRNARTHGDDQVARIAASMVEFGWTVPVLVDGDGGVIAGHGRLLAAHRLGLDSVPVIRLEHLTEAQARAFRIADNQLALNAGWDEDLLRTELQELNEDGVDLELLGFAERELAELLGGLGAGAGGAENDVGDDAAPEPPERPISRLGDLWLLGEHRLLCGDSTKADDVSRLMGGETAALFATDPPYLVAPTAPTAGTTGATSIARSTSRMPRDFCGPCSPRRSRCAETTRPGAAGTPISAPR